MIPQAERQEIIAAKVRDAEEMLRVAEVNFRYDFYNSANFKTGL